MTDRAINGTFYDAEAQEDCRGFLQNGVWRRAVRDWLLALDDASRKIIGKDIQKVEFGWPVGVPYCRPLSGGLHEVRSDVANGRIARVLFLVVAGRMVLLHGFIKKQQKTPKQDLELAERRKKEVLHRDA